MYFLNINKPSGITSFDVIRHLRKKLKIKQSTDTTNEKINNQIEERSKKIQELKNQQHLLLLLAKLKVA